MLVTTGSTKPHRRPTCYISGPITNHPDYRSAFEIAKASMESVGFKAISPVTDCGCSDEFSWELNMQLCLQRMHGCTHILMLAGWESSRGARIEFDNAAATRMTRVEIMADGTVSLKPLTWDDSIWGQLHRVVLAVPTTHTVGASLPIAGLDYEDVCQACYEAHQKRRHVRIMRKI